LRSTAGGSTSYARLAMPSGHTVEMSYLLRRSEVCSEAEPDKTAVRVRSCSGEAGLLIPASGSS